MDWAGLVGLLLDADPRPAAWLDPSGTVLAASATLARLLAARRADLLGQPLWLAFDGDAGKVVEHLVRSTRTSAAASTTVVASARDGRSLRFRLDLAPHGAPRGSGILATASQVEMTVAGRPLSYHPEVGYEVIVDGDFGRLVGYAPMGGGPDEAVLGRAGVRCYQSLHDRASPCADCPLTSVEGPWPRVAVRRLGSLGATELLTAHEPRGGRARLEARRLTDLEYSAAVAAQLLDRARRAGLSEREREVLGRLLRGDALETVARALRITRRTAKFHQDNLLRKLGADSRADLPRVLL